VSAIPRPEGHEDCIEVAPGVLVDPGEGVTIADAEGVVAHWSAGEAAEDGMAFTATVNAAVLAARLGPDAVRRNLADRGATLLRLVAETEAGVLRRPLPEEDVLARLDADGRLVAVVAVGLDELLGLDIGQLYDLCEERILPPDVERIGPCFNAIDVRVAGAVPGGDEGRGAVLLRVSGEVEVRE
jgi:hypothetical protein